MKWFLVIVLSLAYCVAEDYEIQVVSLPTSTPEQNVNLTRIIGGNAASIQKYPFAVQMLYQRRLACGGSLITVRHVLTAAHCFYHVNPQTQQLSLLTLSDFGIIAGSANYQRGGTSRTISRLIVHPAYSASSRDNDVAVLVLNKNLKTSNSIGVVALPQQGNTVPDNAVVWTVGWGTTQVGVDNPPTTLQEVQLWTVNRTVCAQNYLTLELQNPRETYRVTNTMICSGVLNTGGRDACQGDSGGPLLYSGIVVGVTSWGYSCAHPLYPGVNAMTSAYTNWIQETVRMYNAGPPMGSISGILVFTSLISSLLIGSQL